MIELNIPGRGSLQLHHLVADVNGTLAVDGQLLDGLVKKISALRDRLTVHLLTADTHKADYVRSLGAETVVAIGQGANDAGMLAAAALGICVMSQEGVAVETLLAADLVTPDIFAALELLDKPLRIVASLRK